MINKEAIPKFDIKSVIKSDIKFDISTKLTTWIGHKISFTHSRLYKDIGSKAFFTMATLLMPLLENDLLYEIHNPS